VRHSSARNLWLRVETTNDSLLIEGTDDGVGATKLNCGHGLRGMRERVEALRGSLDIITAPGAGVAINVRMPIGAEA
jgi:two-component system sensor histidine kinase DesK